jgi:diacylglycerol kinase family enzyme
MKVIALINPEAGSVTANGANRMARALASMGLEDADVIEFDPRASDAQLLELTALKPDFLIVWGGDGTHRSALKIAGQNSPNLVLLPGGTMNLLSKSLHGHKPWDAILHAVITAPKPQTLPAGKLNEEPFFCAMLAGTPARLAEARESLRHGNIGLAISEARVALDTVANLHLVARYGDGYSFDDGPLPETSVIAALVGPLSHNGRMEVACLSHPFLGSALDAVWSSFHAGWRNLQGLTVVPAQTLVIDNEDGDSIPVIVDGEAIKVGTHLRVTYVEAAARCLIAG